MKKKGRKIERHVHQAIEKLYEDLSRLGDGLEEFRARKVDIVVAFSGGCDSMVLLDAIARYDSPIKGRVVAVYVNHHISPNSDKWAEFCREKAKGLRAEFIEKKVSVSKKGEGLEAAARLQRYKALNDVLQKEKCLAIVTAHHLDDQIETFLIQWMRGAGPDGLASMPYLKRGSRLVRPFLNLKRSQLEAFADLHQMEWIEDESNADSHYLRNYLRLNVIPQLEKARRGFKAAAGRSVQLLSDSVTILKEIDEEDLQSCLLPTNDKVIQLDKFLALSEPRQARTFRLWMNRLDFPTLPKVRLNELIRQIKESEKKNFNLYQKGDRGIFVNFNLLTVEKVVPVGEEVYSQTFTWEGQAAIRFPGVEGLLEIVENPSGFSESYLRALPLTFELAKRSNQKIKIHKLRPSKQLKVLYRERGIPLHERGLLPKIWRDGKLIYAAGVGEDVREKLYQDDKVKKYSFKWAKDPELF